MKDIKSEVSFIVPFAFILFTTFIYYVFILFNHFSTDMPFVNEVPYNWTAFLFPLFLVFLMRYIRLNKEKHPEDFASTIEWFVFHHGFSRPSLSVYTVVFLFFIPFPLMFIGQFFDIPPQTELSFAISSTLFFVGLLSLHRPKGYTAPSTEIIPGVYVDFIRFEFHTKTEVEKYHVLFQHNDAPLSLTTVLWALDQIEIDLETLETRTNTLLQKKDNGEISVSTFYQNETLWSYTFPPTTDEYNEIELKAFLSLLTDNTLNPKKEE